MTKVGSSVPDGWERDRPGDLRGRLRPDGLEQDPRPRATRWPQSSAAAPSTPAEVAAAGDVTISMLADGAAVEAVYGGPDGVIAGARPGSVVVDMRDGPAVHDPAPRRGHP